MLSQYLNPTSAQWNQANPIRPDQFRDPMLSEGDLTQWQEPLNSADYQTRYQSLPQWEQTYLRNPLSDEQLFGLMNKQVADKARKVRLRADIQNAQRQSELLDSLGPNDLSGIYSAPTDARGAQVQSILNRDYQGRELGSKLSLAGMYYNAALNRKLAQEQFDNNIKLRSLNEQIARDKANQNLTAQSLGLRTTNAGNLNTYRNARLDQIDQSEIDRVASQTANRAIAQQNVDLRKRMSDASTARTDFGDWVRALRAGAPMEQLDAALTELWPTLSPTNQNVAMAYAQQRAGQGDVAASQAQQYENVIRHATAGMTDANQIKSTVDQIVRSIGRDPSARGQIYYDPNTRTVSPVPGNQNVQPYSPPGYSNPSRAGISANDSGFADAMGQLDSGAAAGIANTMSGANVDMRQQSAVGQVQDVPPAQQLRFREGLQYPKSDGSVWLYSRGRMTRVR